MGINFLFLNFEPFTVSGLPKKSFANQLVWHFPELPKTNSDSNLRSVGAHVVGNPATRRWRVRGKKSA